MPDESYDPTDFLHSFGQGVFLGPRPSQTVLISENEVDSTIPYLAINVSERQNVLVQNKLQVLADGTIIKAEPEETPENGLRVRPLFIFAKKFLRLRNGDSPTTSK